MVDIKPDDLLGAWEVAEVLGITKQAVLSRRREGMFPEPFRQLRMGPIWLRSQIEPLKKKKKKPKGDNDTASSNSGGSHSAVNSSAGPGQNDEGRRWKAIRNALEWRITVGTHGRNNRGNRARDTYDPTEYTIPVPEPLHAPVGLTSSLANDALWLHWL